MLVLFDNPDKLALLFGNEFVLDDELIVVPVEFKLDGDEDFDDDVATGWLVKGECCGEEGTEVLSFTVPLLLVPINFEEFEELFDIFFFKTIFLCTIILYVKILL